jgi:peroxiredoxin
MISPPTISENRVHFCGSIAFALWMTLLVGCGAAPTQPQISGPISGPNGAPAKTVDFEWTTMTGEPIKLSDFRGQVVLVSLFTTWCVPCAEQLSEFNRLLHGKTPIKGFAVIGVSLDLKPKTMVPPFVEYWRLDVPVAFPDAATLHGRTPFGSFSAVPTTFLVDSAGRHIETLAGAVPTAYIRRRIDELNGETK